MEKIESFKVDHTTLNKGMYISRIDDNITTYDIRMVKPNTPPYLENSGIHTFEHLFATYARNSKFKSNIVYIGPMGCRTGFYLLTKDMSHEDAIDLVKNSMKYISTFFGNIPGSSEIECGNYLDHNLNLAKQYALNMEKILENWSIEDLAYIKC